MRKFQSPISPLISSIFIKFHSYFHSSWTSLTRDIMVKIWENIPMNIDKKIRGNHWWIGYFFFFILSNRSWISRSSVSGGLNSESVVIGEEEEEEIMKEWRRRMDGISPDSAAWWRGDNPSPSGTSKPNTQCTHIHYYPGIGGNDSISITHSLSLCLCLCDLCDILQKLKHGGEVHHPAHSTFSLLFTKSYHTHTHIYNPPRHI